MSLAQRFSVCVRTRLRSSEWNKTRQNTAPEGLFENSPALQRRENCGDRPSPGGTTEVLTHILQRWENGKNDSSHGEPALREVEGSEFSPPQAKSYPANSGFGSAAAQPAGLRA